MRNIFYAASLLLCTSVLFCSCEKAGTEDEKNTSAIVGCWVDEEEAIRGKIYFYLEFTDSGLIYEYYAPGKDDATFKDGVLFFPGEWKIDDTYKYWIDDGLLYWDEYRRTSLIV